MIKFNFETAGPLTQIYWLWEQQEKLFPYFVRRLCHLKWNELNSSSKNEPDEKGSELRFF